VAKLTAALTPSSRFSFRSIRAAQDAQVIPPMASSATVIPAQSSRLGHSGSGIPAQPVASR
jgi:hypothetical protein